MKYQSARQNLLFVIGIYLLTRLPFLSFNDAEFTDAYQMIAWSIVGGYKWHPLYPLTIRAFSIFLDPILSGRILSVLFGCFSIYFLQRLTQKIYGNPAALWASLFFVVSPLLLWVQVRVLTESLFIFTALASLYYFYDVFDGQFKWSFCLLVLFCGACALTRPEGIFTLLLIAIAGIFIIRQKNWLHVLYAMPALAPWGLLAAWFLLRSGRFHYQMDAFHSYQQLSIQKVHIYFVSYSEAYPYVAFYPIFLLGLYHLLTRAKRKWAVCIVLIHVLWFSILVFLWSWTTRLLILPVTILLVEAGSMFAVLQTKMRAPAWRIFAVLLLLFSGIFAVISLYFQKETFADFKESALFVKEIRNNQRVFSDELFKVRYYVQSPVLQYSRNADFHPGDLIVLHSFHTALREEVLGLDEQYKIAIVYSAKARTIPVLASGLAATMEETNQISMMQRRFSWQPSSSIVLRVLAMKEPHP